MAGNPESEVEIGGKTIIKRSESPTAGGSRFAWQWETGEVNYTIEARFPNDETERLVEELIAALPEIAAPPPELPIDASIVEPFRTMQEEVDFDLALPTELYGFQLQPGGISRSGPPAWPVVMATFTDNSSQPFRMVGLMQSAGGLGEQPDRTGHEPVDVVILGVETTLYTETRDDGSEIHRVRWVMNDITYDLAATNVDLNTVLDIANSITYLDDIGDAAPTDAGTATTNDFPQDPIEFAREP